MLLALVCLPSFADDTLIEDYIERVKEGPLTEEDVDEYNNLYANQALSYYLEAHIALSNYDYEKAYPLLESALSSLDEASLTLKYEILSLITYIDHEFNNDESKYISTLLQMKEIADEINYPIGMAETRYSLANAYIDDGDSNEAMVIAEDAFEISQSTDYKEGIYSYYLYLWYFEYMNWNLESALQYLDLAENYYIENSFYTAFYNPIDELERYRAMTYYWMDQPQRAIETLEQLLAVHDTNNLVSISYIHNSLGFYYEKIDPDMTMYHYEKALEVYGMAKTYDLSGYYSNVLNESLAYGYYGIGEYEKSAHYFYETSEYYYNMGIDQGLDRESKSVTEQLDEYKYAEITEQVSLLEQLADQRAERVKAQQRLLYISLASITILLSFLIIIFIEIRSKNKSQKALYISSITDSLTQVFNRGKIIEIFEEKMDQENAVILLDIDNFKEINDHYGHVVGDQVLKVIAEVIKDAVRACDSVGRYGGEEFLIVLENAKEEEIVSVSERIRKNVESHQWPYEDLVTTCSVGVCNIYSDDADDVLHHVDQLMYKAKAKGKNQVVYE